MSESHPCVCNASFVCQSTVDVVQVARAAGLPCWLDGARCRICTTPRLYVHDGYITAATVGMMDTSQQRLQARCQRQRDQRRSRRAAETAEQSETRLQHERYQWRNRMAAETAEQREERLQRDQDQRRSRRAVETATAVVLHV